MHENIVRLKAVAHLLKGIGQPYVFVGGATVSLYNSEPAVAKPIRPTEDVDVVIELVTYKDYAEIDGRLRAMGFANDVTSGVICRYRIQGMIVDIMPTEPVIGFSNRWYPEGFRHAIPHDLDAETRILIFSLPYFLASKWEAHKSRGGRDLRTSKDFEDMVYIFENCNDFDRQLLTGPRNVLSYLQKEFSGFIDHPDFEEAVYGHMEDTTYTGIIPQLKAALNLN